jgi:hypothetical protein
MMRRKSNHWEIGKGNLERIPRVPKEVATPLLLWKPRGEAKWERAMANKPPSQALGHIVLQARYA